MDIKPNKITRLEVINHNVPESSDEFGRQMVKYFKEGQLDISLQDDGRTLKIFLNNGEDNA